MGDIAEAMISGDLCSECGCALECEGEGIPIMCHDCHSQYQKSCKQPHCGKDGGIMCENFYLNK